MARPTILDYLVGGLLGNAPVIFLFLGLTFVELSTLRANLGLINAIILASMFGGALLAGFLVARTAGTVYISRLVAVGVVTSLFCYMVNYLLALILLFPTVFSELVGLGTFASGSILGALLRSVVGRGRKGIR